MSAPPRLATRGLAALLALLLAAALGACEEPERGHGGRGLEPEGADTVVWGEDRRQLAADSLAVLWDSVPDRTFLEVMLDHYETLDYLVDRAFNPASRSAVRGLAWKRDRKAEAGQQRIRALLRSEYGVRYQPVVAERYRVAADALRSDPDAHYEGRFYRLLLDLHGDALATLDSAEPRLRNRAVRTLAGRLRDFHVGEVARLRAEAPR